MELTDNRQSAIAMPSGIRWAADQPSLRHAYFNENKHVIMLMNSERVAHKSQDWRIWPWHGKIVSLLSRLLPPTG